MTADMRILIVGAGVAGLTLAALLRRQGKAPVIIDQRPDIGLGYALALWPQGTRVLHALNVHDAFIAESEPMLRYTLRDSDDRLVESYDMQRTIGRFGHLGIISRPDFIALLERTVGSLEVRHGIGIESLLQADNRVDVRLSDGAEASFDLVVGADGIHSRVRELLFGRLPERDTGWGCFVWWTTRASRPRARRSSDGVPEVFLEPIRVVIDCASSPARRLILSS